MNFRLGELFSGPGGLAYGAIHAHSDDRKYTVSSEWANDYDCDSCLTHSRNIGGKVHFCDVRELDIDALGDIDAFAYGFPCNSFSSVGEHQGLENEKFGQLYYYGVKVLQRYQPQWFIAENVSGIRSAGDALKVILRDLRDCGYRLNVNLYKSELYGVPQTRHRVIIVGIRDDLDVVYRVPSTEDFMPIDVSSRSALSNIPKDAPNQEKRKVQKSVVERLSLIRPGENLWQAEERLGDAFPERLKIKTKTRISQIYRKLDPDKPAYTVTASGGGGTFMYHWTDRELTNRERARLQTFPDDFEFLGDYSSVRKQIGMAVPCRLSNIVTTAILNSFAGFDYNSMEPNIDIDKLI